MALHRGIQSAIFYYLSCAPCTEARQRHKRRKAADLAKLEKEALDAQGSDVAYQYKHPLPANTNPAWNLEIAIGPSKESKAAAKARSKKEAESAPRSSDSTNKSDNTKVPSSISDLDSEHQAKVQWASSFQRTCLDESLITIPEQAHTNRLSQIRSPALPKSASTPDSMASPAWVSPRNPPLNDLHPPTVTRYDSPADIGWMLEPPPPARVMRGYEQERPRKSPLTPRPTTSSIPKHIAEKANRRDSIEDPQGLGLSYQADGEDSDEPTSEHEIATDGIEKRDSAGPVPARDHKGEFLFPPREWANRGRKDSARPFTEDDSDFESDLNKRRHDEDHPQTRPSRLRWRWSMDF